MARAALGWSVQDCAERPMSAGPPSIGSKLEQGSPIPSTLGLDPPAFEAAGVEFIPTAACGCARRPMQSSKLAPQARPHALAELEVTIAKAKAERDRYRQSMSRASDDDDLRRAKAFLRIAEQRLTHL